jgi:hypothetical protein
MFPVPSSSVAPASSRHGDARMVALRSHEDITKFSERLPFPRRCRII